MAAEKGVYTQSFARLIQVPTVTGSDRKHFAEFRKVLAEEFPAVFRVCEVIRPGGDDSDAIMFKWKGASSERPVVLMAHQDVVPAVDGDWKYDPYSATVADGKIWGRGTMDCKNTLFCDCLPLGLCDAADGQTIAAKPSARRHASPFKTRPHDPMKLCKLLRGDVHFHKRCAVISFAELRTVDEGDIFKGTVGKIQPQRIDAPARIVFPLAVKPEAFVFHVILLRRTAPIPEIKKPAGSNRTSPPVWFLRVTISLVKDRLKRYFSLICSVTLRPVTHKRKTPKAMTKNDKLQL